MSPFLVLPSPPPAEYKTSHTQMVHAGGSSANSHHNAPSLHHLFQTFVRGTGLGLSSVLVGLPCPLLKNGALVSHWVVAVRVSPPFYLSPSTTVPGLFTFLEESPSLQIICGLEISAAWPGLEPL